ncbi:unnamed protein product [Agarophyton chilense]
MKTSKTGEQNSIYNWPIFEGVSLPAQLKHSGVLLLEFRNLFSPSSANKNAVASMDVALMSSASDASDFHEQSFSVTSPGIFFAALSSSTLSDRTLHCVSTGVEHKEGVAYVWDVTSHPLSLKLRGKLRHPSRVYRAVLSSDASTAITTCQDGDIRVWSAAGKDYNMKKLPFHRSCKNARSCAISEDGKYAAVSFYKGSRRGIENDRSNPVSTFQSEVFVFRLKSSLELFRTTEDGIADQVMLSENASVIAIGLCGVHPAPKVARGHRIVLVNNLGRLLTIIRDSFPPDQHGCTSWHMSPNGSMLSLCSKNNNLHVYHSGHRKDWTQPPTILESRAFQKFSRCRFVGNSDLLCAVGTAGKFKEAILGLFRVSDATLLFVLPVHISIGTILDIHPYISVSDRPQFDNPSISLSFISAKASKSGPVLNLNNFSNSRESSCKATGLSHSELKIPDSTSGHHLNNSSRSPEKNQTTNSGHTPFRLCRDPSPLSAPRTESPSASRSSAAMRSSDSSSKTPLHSRFASWLIDNEGKCSVTRSETELGQSGFCENQTSGQNKDPTPPGSGELVLDRQRQACRRLPNDHITPLLEKQKSTQLREADVHIATQGSSEKPPTLMNTKSMNRLKPVSLSKSGLEPKSRTKSETENAGILHESHLKSKKSLSPSSTDKQIIFPVPEENSSIGLREKTLVQNEKDDKALSTLEAPNIETSSNQRKETLHGQVASLKQNFKASEYSSSTGHNSNTKEHHQRCKPQPKQRVMQPCTQNENVVKTLQKKTCEPSSPVQKCTHDPVQKSREKMSAIVNDEKSKLGDLEQKENDPGLREDKSIRMTEGKAQRRSLHDEGRGKTCDSHTTLKKIRDKDKDKERTTALSESPQSEDWTPANRFAAREHNRMRKSATVCKVNGSTQDLKSPTLRKSVPDPNNTKSPSKANQEQVRAENETTRPASREAMLAKSTLKRSRGCKGGIVEKCSHDLSMLTKQNVKTEATAIPNERDLVIVQEINKTKETTGEPQRKEDSCIVVISSRAGSAQELRACDPSKSVVFKVEDIPDSAHDLSVPKETPVQNSGVGGEHLRTPSVDDKDKQPLPRTAAHNSLGADNTRTTSAQREIHQTMAHKSLGTDNTTTASTQREINSERNPKSIPARYLELCTKAFVEACRAFQVPDINTLTNQEAYTTMLGLVEREFGFTEKKCVAKMIYDVVGIQNACTLQMFIEAFQQILERVIALRRLFWADVFSRATCKAEESILLFHARDLLKAEHRRGRIHMTEQWTDSELESLFERVSDGMLVNIKSFLQCVDRIIDG